jgi:anti-sigma factor ChrR (cupin superfamily)
MTSHDHLTDELRELAALHALGALEGPEAREFGAHLAGCDVCRAEVGACEEAAAGLAEAVSPAEPPPALRARVLADLEGAEANSTALDPLRTSIVRDTETGWTELSPGVSTRTLFEDAATGRITALVRMRPGASVEPHRHLATEEVFILEGDCHVAPGQMLRPGDYFRAEAGSMHMYTYSEQGTLFLSVYENEFL